MNRYAGHNEPEDVLDFHDFGRIDYGTVHKETLAFVKASSKRGFTRLRIVIGKGATAARASRW